MFSYVMYMALKVAAGFLPKLASCSCLRARCGGSSSESEPIGARARRTGVASHAPPSAMARPVEAQDKFFESTEV